jgi:hypothetical protein
MRPSAAAARKTAKRRFLELCGYSPLWLTMSFLAVDDIGVPVTAISRAERAPPAMAVDRSDLMA